MRFLFLFLFSITTWALDFNEETPTYTSATNMKSERVVEVVRNYTRVKILQSNNVGLRPGSIYDNITLFESLLSFPQPGFNYEFVDSGLGAAEPLYPMYQKGHQESWFQLLPAFFSKKARHIDHFTVLTTPEGCLVEGLYGLRHISEYPKDVFVKERAEGYEQVVVRLEYYTKLRADAQCGRHMAYEPDPNFSPINFVRKYRKAMYITDFPQKELERFEWKLSVIKHLSEERNKKKWPRFDLAKLEQNSLWYYPQGHSDDFDLREQRPQPGLRFFNLPRHMIVPSTKDLQQEFPLEKLLGSSQFQQLFDFMNGKPKAGFDPSSEPGNDTLKLSDVTENNIYTSGLYLERIKNVFEDVQNPRNYRLVAMTIKPFEEQMDSHWHEKKVIPQIRFVYQMIDPRHPERQFEELYFHLKFDVVDRQASDEQQKVQHQYFLKKVDQLTEARAQGGRVAEKKIAEFINEFTRTPIESVAFSSSLTGIWVFGALVRNYDQLEPLRIMRNGVDVGYYSSTYDNDLFREAIERSSGARKQSLMEHMDLITPITYRDPRRLNVEKIQFNTMTCAQCHQTSGRDGVHVSLNDGIDRRITSPVRASEFFFHDADQQLQKGIKYWVEGLKKE